MQIQKINIYSYNKKPFKAKTEGVTEPVVAEKKGNKDNKNKKIAIGLSIAGVLLLGFIFRKNIKNLFKGNKPTEPPKPPIEPPIEPPNPPVKPEKPEFDGQKALEEFHQIRDNLTEYPSKGSEAEKAAWRKTDERRMALRRILEANNISIIRRKDFPTSPLENSAEKLRYLTNLISESGFNRATQDDVISEYAKYAGRYWFDRSTGKSFIGYYTTVCSPIEQERDNKEYKYELAEKYIDVVEKIAERDNVMRDAIKIIYTLQRYGDVMDEKLALRYIELLKKISFQQIDEHSVYYATRHLQEIPTIKQAMEEYHNILQSFPVEDNTNFYN